MNTEHLPCFARKDYQKVAITRMYWDVDDMERMFGIGSVHHFSELGSIGNGLTSLMKK